MDRFGSMMIDLTALIEEMNVQPTIIESEV